MAIHTSEQDQLETLRGWWRTYRGALIAGVLLGVALLAGWQGWAIYAEARAQRAAALFAQMEEALDAQRDADAQTRGAELIRDYPRAIQAVDAALALAARAVAQGDIQEARKRLRWALDATDQPTLRRVARFNLARLALDEGKPAEALDLLEGADFGAFDGLYAEVRGDAYRLLEKPAAARTAYREALAILRADAPSEVLLRMKLEALEENPATAERMNNNE